MVERYNTQVRSVTPNQHVTVHSPEEDAPA